MDSMRRGSMNHVKGQFGAFWAEGTMSARSRIFSINSKGNESGVNGVERSRILSIYSKGGDDAVNTSIRKTIPADDSFLDF